MSVGVQERVTGSGECECEFGGGGRQTGGGGGGTGCARASMSSSPRGNLRGSQASRSTGEVASWPSTLLLGERRGRWCSLPSLGPSAGKSDVELVRGRFL